MRMIEIPVTMDELVALWKLRHGEIEFASRTNSRPATHSVVKKAEATKVSPPIALAAGKFQYKILGEQRSARSSVAAFLDVLTTLSSLEPSLPARLAPVVSGNTRNHIARSPSEVYPDRPDLGRKSREFAPGWYAGINIADREKRRILRLACGILDFKFGKDIAF